MPFLGRSGGIGRRVGFKIRFPQGSVGSSPTAGIARIEIRLGIGRSFLMFYAVGMWVVICTVALALWGIAQFYSDGSSRKGGGDH